MSRKRLERTLKVSRELEKQIADPATRICAAILYTSYHPAGDGMEREGPEPLGARRLGMRPATVTAHLRESSPLGNALVQWRKTTAAKEKTKAYMVLTNRSLREIVKKRPATKADLTTIFGFGPTKIEKYGPAILDLVKQAHTADHPAEPGDYDPNEFAALRKLVLRTLRRDGPQTDDELMARLPELAVDPTALAELLRDGKVTVDDNRRYHRVKVKKGT